MSLPADVTAFLRRSYPADHQDEAVRLLENAQLHDGRPPDARLLRCAVFAGRGDLERLKALVDLLAIDWRDVIVAGEYETEGKRLIFARSFRHPLDVP